MTPHLGATTREAQDKAGDTIADMVQLALAGEFVPFAVNINAAEANETLRPFLPLAERLGRLFASLRAGARSARGVRRRRARRLRHAHPHPRRAQGLLRRPQGRAGHLRQRAAAGQGQWRRRPRGQLRLLADFVNLITLRGGGAQHVGHAHRPAQRAAHRRHRRAHVRRATADYMLMVQERRPSRSHRCRRHAARRCRRQHRRHGRGSRQDARAPR